MMATIIWIGTASRILIICLTCPNSPYDSHRHSGGDIHTPGRVYTKDKNNKNNNSDEQKEAEELKHNKGEHE